MPFTRLWTVTYGDDGKNSDNKEEYTAQELSEYLAASHDYGVVGPAPRDDPRHVAQRITKSHGDDDDGDGGDAEEFFASSVASSEKTAAKKKKGK